MRTIDTGGLLVLRNFDVAKVSCALPSAQHLDEGILNPSKSPLVHKTMHHITSLITIDYFLNERSLIG